MLKRNLSEKIKRCLGQFPAVALTGTRQSGKTTLAKAFCPDWDYLDLERGVDFDALEIKFGTSIRRAQLKSLAAFIEQENCPYGMVSPAEKAQLLTETIIQIPAGCL